MNYELISKIREQAPRFIAWAVSGLDKLKVADFIMPLLIRLYLAPVMWMAGANKFSGFSNTVEWFGNEEWGLGLPLPYLLVFLVASAEILGAILLFFGAGVRLISVPLMAIMLVAALTVHWKNGWLAIATGDGLFATERTVGAIERLDRAKGILQDYGNYSWLTENGGFVVLNNGIEFAATYFIMLLTLFFVGGGRYFSADYWIKRRFMEK